MSESTTSSDETTGSSDQPSPATWRRLLVPIDFSSASEAAVQVAARMARRSGGCITLLHVIEISWNVAVASQADGVASMVNGGVRLEATASSLRATGLRAVPFVVEGMPAEEIIAFAKHHDVVVIGKPGKSRRWRLFAKRTLRQVVEVCSRAVVVVPG